MLCVLCYMLYVMCDVLCSVCHVLCVVRSSGSRGETQMTLFTHHVLWETF